LLRLVGLREWESGGFVGGIFGGFGGGECLGRASAGAGGWIQHGGSCAERAALLFDVLRREKGLWSVGAGRVERQSFSGLSGQGIGVGPFGVYYLDGLGKRPDVRGLGAG
jgi:hypothetical protein